MELKTLQDLYVQELKDLYDAENQLLKALPKMAKAASSDELREAFEMHLEETEGQVERLEQIFERLGTSPKGKKCKAMAGLIEEGKEAIEEEAADDVRDVALITAAQKTEHYEIAGYGCCATYARVLGNEEDVELLEQTLEEEKEADIKLTELAEGCINLEAVDGDVEDGEDEPKSSKATAGRKGK